VRRKPTDILGMVEEHLAQTQPLRDRMDDDYRLERLEPFTHEDLDGFHTTTHSEPRTQGRKILSLLTTAKRLIQVSQAQKDKDERSVSDEAERFYLGIFSVNDERLVRSGQTKLQTGLSWHGAFRGFKMGRALLVKNNGSHVPRPDITPFDPRNTYWELGANGPLWMIHKVWKTVRQIKNEYGVNVKSELVPANSQLGIPVYEWFDDEHTGVVLERQVLKKPTLHGSPEIPVFFTAVGPAPFIFSENISDTIKDWGESIYAANREVWKEMNFVQSEMSELISRSVKQPYVTVSRDGSLTLDFNPWEHGRETSLQQGDEIKALDQMQMAPETGAMLGILSGMAQRGGIPHSSFGALPSGAAISGFAIGQLRQGQSTPIEAPIEALESVYTQIMRLMKMQYISGGFEQMTLTGRDQSGAHEFFSQEIPVEVVRDGGDPTIVFTATLPQDDIQNAAMAAQLTAPDALGVRLVPPRWARENILQIQDADRVGDEVRAERATNSAPLAMIHANMLAAIEIGNDQLASIYIGEAQKQTIRDFLELLQLQLQAFGLTQVATQATGGATGGGTPAGPPRMDQRVLPRQAAGGAQEQPTPQAGPNVPAGTPRPGSGLLGPTGEPILGG
jgi:hypothetical protein